MNPPLPISGIDQLQRMDFPGGCSGVYFLCDGDEVVYVGQSTFVICRIAEHMREGRKIFDSVFVLPCEKDQLLKTEEHWIIVLRPKYNLSSIKGQPHPYHYTEPWTTGEAVAAHKLRQAILYGKVAP